MKKTCKIIYVTVCLLVMILPFAGMLWFKTDTTTENKTLAVLPEWTDGNGINENYLSELGVYFEDHFAFRNYMVDMDSNIQANVFRTSNSDSIIVGNDGWLFYSATLDNYLDKNGLSERGIFNAVHNIKMLQNYVEAQGAQFLLAIPPNKNSLYDENMPYYYRYNAGETDNELNITEEIKNQNISYVNLFDEFRTNDKTLYLKRDSHWSNEGAVLAYNSIMEALDRPHERYETVDAVRTKDYIGDLNRMMYPVSSKPEWNINYIYESSFSYVGSDDVSDNRLETVNPEKNGTCLMFRDSFGNTLIPLISEEFGSCHYLKSVPYNIEKLMKECNPDTVIVEKVERNIEEFARIPAVFSNPVFEAEEAGVAADESEKTSDGVAADYSSKLSDITVKTADANSDFIAISGVVNSESLKTNTLIYVEVKNDTESKIYEAFTISDDASDNGYLVYINKSELTADKYGLTVYVGADMTLIPVSDGTFDINELQ